MLKKCSTSSDTFEKKKFQSKVILPSGFDAWVYSIPFIQVIQLQSTFCCLSQLLYDFLELPLKAKTIYRFSEDHDLDT